METNVASRIRHVAVYLRISQEKKGENADTLLKHREILTAYATEQGWTYVLYEEVLSGGKSDLHQRPKLEQLLNEIERYDGLLVMELSRLARNGLVSEQILQACKDNQKPVITKEKVYDLNNSNDVLSYRFGSIIASDEHDRIGKRSKANKMAMAKQGLHISGSVPWGYVRNPATKRLEIDEPNAEIIRYIYRLYIEGEGCYRIRDILNGEGYKSATGKAFSLTAIMKILRNPTYKGTVVFNDRNKVKRNGKFEHVSVNEITVEDAHPAIISKEDWDIANGLRVARAIPAFQTRDKPAPKTGVIALKDLLYCGKCGRKLTINKDHKSNTHHVKLCDYLMEDGSKCNNAGIRIDYAEELVMQEVAQLRGEVEQELARLMDADTTNITADIEEQLHRIDKQITEQEKAFSTLIDLALQGIFTAQEIAGKKQEITDRLAVLQAEKVAVIDRLANTNVETATNRLTHVLTVLDELEQGATPATLNQHLKRFINKVYYRRDMPREILQLSPNNPKRRDHPFSIEIEYI
jgi:DNA invertase Pin-like site-specific DNA recombinase